MLTRDVSEEEVDQIFSFLILQNKLKAGFLSDVFKQWHEKRWLSLRQKEILVNIFEMENKIKNAKLTLMPKLSLSFPVSATPAALPGTSKEEVDLSPEAFGVYYNE